jgi:hypothetical protein
MILNRERYFYLTESKKNTYSQRNTNKNKVKRIISFFDFIFTYILNKTNAKTWKTHTLILKQSHQTLFACACRPITVQARTLFTQAVIRLTHSTRHS